MTSGAKNGIIGWLVVDRHEPMALRNAEIVASPSMVMRQYEAVARLVVTEPPVWLADVLHTWASSLRLQAGMMAFQPSRPKMRKSLQSVQAAALTIRNALGDRSVREFLDAAGEGKIGYHGDIDAYLIDLYARATRAYAGPKLATSAGTTKAGTGPALPAGAIPAASLCALIIVEAWKHVRGAYPGSRNERAARAAEAYWKICGNTRNSRGPNPLTAWRRRFEEVMPPSFDRHRQDVLRVLWGAVEYARLTARPSDPGVDSNPPAGGSI